MSLINQMLRDLDKRQGSAGRLERGPALVVRPRRAPYGRYLAALGLAAVAAWHLRPAKESPPPGSAAYRQEAPPPPTAALAAAEPLQAPPPLAAPAKAEPAAGREDAAVPKTDSRADGQGVSLPSPPSAPRPETEKRTTPAPLQTKKPAALPAYAGKEPAVGGRSVGKPGFTRLPVPEEDSAAALAARGERLAEAGDTDRARDLLERALRLEPERWQTRRSLARLLIQQRDWENAETVLDGGRTASGSELAELKARIYLHRQRPDAAAAVLEAARAAGRADDVLLGTLGAVYKELNRNPEAAAAYRQALERKPDEGRWWLGLAVSLDGDRHSSDASAAYREALARPGLSPAAAAYARERLEALGNAGGGR